jgi:hypothetical protein
MNGSVEFRVFLPARPLHGSNVTAEKGHVPDGHEFEAGWGLNVLIGMDMALEESGSRRSPSENVARSIEKF